MRFGVGRSPALRRGVLALAAAGALGLCGWAAGGAAKPGAVLAGAALLWLACTGTALRFVAWLPQGDLAWDGAVWRFESGSGRAFMGVLRVHMDGQSRLLVSLQGDRTLWLWLERRMQPERWADLRRAVYSRPGPDAGPGFSPVS